MKTRNIIITIMLVSVMPMFGLAMGQLHKTNQVQKQHDVYYCPMHPDILYDHPGNCPICGMKLIKKEAGSVVKRPACGCCGMKHS